MRQPILVIAVLFLSLFSSDTFAQIQSAEKIENARKSYQQGLGLMENGQLAQAAEIFRQALQFDPEYADAYAALGRTYFKLREWQKALDNLNRAASLKSKQREASESALNKAPVVQPAPLPKASPVNLIEVNKSAPLILATLKETQSPAPQLKAVEAEVKPVAAPTPAGPAVSTLPRTEEQPLTKIYRVGPNDVLDVRLNDSDQQSTLYTVTAAGLLEHPLLNEPMSVAGLTVEEIGTRIEEDLRQRAIVENPKAVVGVRDYSSHAVLVSGLVKDAGTKFLRREAIPLYVVVADAQPLPEAARVSVVRNESNQIFEIELNQAVDMNFLVRPGDVINLSPESTQFVYIGGEIKLPGEKTFRRGLTLMQAILAAGGVGPKAKIAEIARDNGEGFLVPTRFNLKEIASGKAIDPILKPGDRISILR